VAGPPDYFARPAGDVNFAFMQSKRVVVVGVGTVGSRIAELLANSTVGFLRLIDHDPLEIENPYRHALPVGYLGGNKAIGLADWLPKQVPRLRVDPIDRKIDQSVPAELLERWLDDADLIVAATDDRDAQRRISQQALALGIPAIFPGQYLAGGGEVIVQFDHRLPCFGCWDYFRTSREQLRGVSGLPFAELPVIYTSMRLCIGVLDPDSDHAEMLAEAGRSVPYQAFRLDRSGNIYSHTLTRRQDCPTCSGGPPPPPRPTWFQEGVRQPPVSPTDYLPRKANPVLSVIGEIVAAVGATLLAIGSVVLGLAALCAGAAAASFLVIIVPGYIFLWLLGALLH